VDDLWATKSEDVGLIVRTISFQDFQPMWSWSTNITDRRTDGQTTSNSKTALCTVVHHTVKTIVYLQINGNGPKTAKIVKRWKITQHHIHI